jgi:hypothetical protein
VLQDVDGISITDMHLCQVQRMLAGESSSPVTMSQVHLHIQLLSGSLGA